MFIKTDMNKDDMNSININVLEATTNIISRVLNRVTYDNSDILHKPGVNNLEEYYDNVNVIISKEIKNKFL